MNRDPFAAIADPTRRKIIDLLATGNLNINQIADHFRGISRQAVTKQIIYLEESGLLSIEKAGREKLCYLTLANLNEVNQWMLRYEKFWNTRLDRLNTFLEKGKK
jgi:DNA-binding transcriptional ArsR family regulator